MNVSRALLGVVVLIIRAAVLEVVVLDGRVQVHGAAPGPLLLHGRGPPPSLVRVARLGAPAAHFGASHVQAAIGGGLVVVGAVGVVEGPSTHVFNELQDFVLFIRIGLLVNPVSGKRRSSLYIINLLINQTLFCDTIRRMLATAKGILLVSICRLMEGFKRAVKVQ